MKVGIEAGDVGRKDGYGLGDGNELSRLRLGCFCHIGRSIIVVVSHNSIDIQNSDFGVQKVTSPDVDR